jgi:hypothetical protein
VAVPVALKEEWTYLKANTQLWHRLRGDECPQDPIDLPRMKAETPNYMHLMACKGPAFCERDFRTLSCRQFPFSPYITADDRLIGLTYNWDFEEVCWVISNLAAVTADYRREFFNTFDHIFSTWLEDMDSYIELSVETREHYAAKHRRIPLLHRNSGAYLISPLSERMVRVSVNAFKPFHPYANSHSQDTAQSTHNARVENIRLSGYD